MKPKISVIMSVYNSEKFLNESIQSILNQTFKDFEFIIIDDCSTDNSLKIIKRYADLDDRIKLINNNKNIGLTKSLNKEIKIAQGKYIARQDADDISLPERFKKQFTFLEENENVFLLGSGSISINEKGIKRGIFKPLIFFEKIAKTLPYKNCIHHPSVMFRNLKEYLYREKFFYSQDYDLYLRLLSNNKRFANIKEPLIKYRINPNAISWTKKAKQKLFAEKAKEFYRQRLKFEKDEYNQFDPNKILDIDVEKSTNKIILEQEIFSSFKLNNFKRTRKFCERYFKNYGYLNKLLLYYLLSFTGKNFVNLIRKIIFS